ncbi:copper chaperone PCu(A)C [Novosphingobium sp.]|uniref:copper chaperone PCu(A)C n=1 Tax=Novosphingobium sp. TaxID=1874826 RepID=UPI003B5241EB
MPVSARLVAFVSVLLLAGCSKAPDSQSAPTGDAGPQTEASVATTAPIALSNASVQLPAVPGRPAVAYFTLTAGPGAHGALVSVKVAHFARAELHESRMEGGAMTMSPVESLPITPGKAIVFAPGGLHVMLFDGDGAIKPGDSAALTATLDDGRTLTAQAAVIAQGAGAM